MTRGEAFRIIENITVFQDPDSNYRKALEIALEAFKVIDIVKDIINTSNIIIQEDVLKYKMICEVFKNEGYN